MVHDKQGPEQTAQHSNYYHYTNFFQIKRKVEPEVGVYERGDGVFLPRDNRKDPENKRAARGAEKPAPVVPEGEMRRNDLDAEEDATYRRGERAGHPDRACCRQDVHVLRLVLVGEGGELVDAVVEEGGHDAGYVDERALLADGQLGTDGCHETDHLGDQHFEAQVVVQIHAAEDCFYFGDSRADCLRRDQADKLGAE